MAHRRRHRRHLHRRADLERGDGRDRTGQGPVDAGRSRRRRSSQRSTRLLTRERASTAKAVSYIVHGTTVATNAVLQRRLAATAFVTTDGFRDFSRSRARCARTPTTCSPRSRSRLVPRDLCFEVDGAAGRRRRGRWSRRSTRPRSNALRPKLAATGVEGGRGMPAACLPQSGARTAASASAAARAAARCSPSRCRPTRVGVPRVSARLHDDHQCRPDARVSAAIWTGSTTRSRRRGVAGEPAGHAVQRRHQRLQRRAPSGRCS